MNTKFSIRHIAAFLLIASFAFAPLSAPAQARNLTTTTLQNPLPVADKDDKDDKGPRKPAPKPGPRTGGEGE